MSPDTITLIWLVAGIVLMVAEAGIPGTLVSFFGGAAILVSGLRWLGFIESLPVSIATWLGLSLVLVVSLRGLVQRWSKPERAFQSTDEDVDAYGRTVEVVTQVSDKADVGRIRFGGTTWPARSVKGVLEPGVMVRIVHRDNLVFVVEPLTALPSEHPGS